MMKPVISASRRAPCSAMITPRKTNGTVLSSRCWKLAWMNGEVRIPQMRETFRA